MRDRRLKGVQTIVERQQGMSTKCNDDGFLFDRQNRRSGVLRTCGNIDNRGPALPFGDRLLVDPVSPGKRSQARLTMLYRSTDRLCRSGAPMENLCHSASFESDEKNAPSKSGTKHLGSH